MHATQRELRRCLAARGWTSPRRHLSRFARMPKYDTITPVIIRHVQRALVLLVSLVTLLFLTGNPVWAQIGPHEAGNLPNIGDKVSGQPMTIIIRVGDSPGTIASTINKYRGAGPVVVRITGVTVATTPGGATSIANALNGVTDVLPAGTIVVYGNEMNNLYHEWKSRGRPGEGEDTSADVRAAAQQYAELFVAFSGALSDHYQAAVSTVDVYNGEFRYEPWVEGAAAAYAAADTLVANAYEIPGILTADAAVSAIEAATGMTVSFLTEFGPDPAVSVKEHLDFLTSTTPPRGLTATTLVPNKCGDREFRTDGSTPEPWLYFVDGKLYDVYGAEVQVSEGNNCEGAGFGVGDNVYLFPKDYGEELDKYLANSQVYCAPPQVYEPQPSNRKVIGMDPGPCLEGDDLGPDANGVYANVGDNYCDQVEYEVVHAQETYNLNGMLFPLFRTDSGSISIESDLSRVNPGEPIADAFKRNARADYAPQFYLTNPQQQCLNAVRFIKFAQQKCEDSSLGGDDCGGNITVTMPDGSNTRLFNLAGVLPSEAICENFEENLQEDDQVAQAVRSITPMTPNIYKMGFYVQHTLLVDNDIPFLVSYALETLSMWFTGREALGNSHEKVEVVPIWYLSGLTASQYEEHESGRVYLIDPDDYQPGVTIDTIPDIQPEQIPENNSNFSGPLWATYAPALPDFIQKRFAVDRAQTVVENMAWYRFMDGKFGQTLTNVPGVGEVMLPFRCLNPEDCFCYTDSETDPADAACLNQDWGELGDAFPDYGGFEMTFDYADMLKRKLLRRINAGIQTTVQYPNALDPDNDGPPGPLSGRSFGYGVCPVEDFNEGEQLYGLQETARKIGHKALQELREPRTPIERLTSAIDFKVLSVPAILKLHHTGMPYKELRTVRSYLILPDDAVSIETLQSYVAPMFLSPQMYGSIVSGENPILPFPDELQGSEKWLSAFLRTSGLQRTITAKDEGYIKEQVTPHRPIFCNGVLCNCGEQIGPSVERNWIDVDDFEPQPPTSGNGCFAIGAADSSLVNVTKPFGTDENPQTPGNLWTLHEFLRRMAFTPSHMQAYAEYPGLEDFYMGEGAQFGALEDDELGDPTNNITLTQYIAAFLEGVGQTYTAANRTNSCNLVYIDQTKAQQLGDALSTLFQHDSFRASMPGYPNSHLYSDCGGTVCVDYISQITTSVPVCSGNHFVNPLIAFAVAMNETAGLSGDIAWHYGCNVPAFTKYLPNATLDGLACTVTNAAGNEVINPALIARYGQLSTQVRDACVDVSGGGDRNVAANQQLSPAEGLICFMSVAQSQCILGNSDAQMLQEYGYNPQDSGAQGSVENLLGRIDDLLTLSHRRLGNELPENQDVIEALGIIRQARNELTMRLAACPK